MTKFIVSQDGPYRAKHPPSPTRRCCRHQTLTLGLPVSAGAASQDRLWEQGRRAGVSPLQPTIAAALQVAELPPTAEAGAAHRPGADAGRVRSKAHKD